MSDDNLHSQTFTEKLVAYLDGELPEGDAREVEQSLASDPAMRTEVEQLNRAWELLDLLPRPNASGQFSSRTLATLKVGGQTTELESELCVSPTVTLDAKHWECTMAVPDGIKTRCTEYNYKGR